MGDLTSLTKVKMELEQLYLGIPDDSVNLTFQDLATINQQHVTASAGEKMVIMKPSTTPIDPISRSHPLKPQEYAGPAVMKKLPSLDFSKGLAESSHHQYQRPNHDLDPSLPEYAQTPIESYRMGSGSQWHISDSNGVETRSPHRKRLNSPSDMRQGAHNPIYHDMSAISMSMSMMSTASGDHHQVRGRRPGIPHSNICTLCTTYVYIFRHRCLVCGRAYCRSCVGMGMGEMTEGRKCLDCFGRRFSARYIQRAGTVGCCAMYPSSVKQAELKWAERGPRKTGERGYGLGRLRSPPTPLRAGPSNPASFVMTSPYTANPHPHHLPF